MTEMLSNCAPELLVHASLMLWIPGFRVIVPVLVAVRLFCPLQDITVTPSTWTLPLLFHCDFVLFLVATCIETV